MVPLYYYLFLSGILFAIGVAGVVIRRNLIVILMSIELMLNAVNLTFIAFSRFVESAQPINGHVFVIFIITVAAAEAAVALALAVVVYRNRTTIDIDKINLLRW